MTPDKNTEVTEAQVKDETESGITEVETTAADKPEGAVAVKNNKRRIVGLVFSCICLAIVAFLLFCVIWLVVDKFVKKSPVPSLFGVSWLVVETGSMAPTINEGDLILITKTGDYKIGDIITFMPEGDTIPTTHRIIRIDSENGLYYTKGDHNNAEDTRPVTDSQIVGELKSTVPHVGLFFRWLSDGFGWLFIVGIIAVIVVGVVLLKKIPSDKNKR